MTAPYRFLAAVILLWSTTAARAADPLPPELDLIPWNADVVVSVRVAKLWESELFQSYRKFIGANTEALADMFGHRPDDIERLTVVVTGDDVYAVVTTIKPIDLKKVLAAFAPRGVERKIGGAICYRDEERWVTVAYLDAHVLMIGAPEAVELYITHGHKREGLPHAETIMLAAKHDVVLAASDGEAGWKALAAALPDTFKKVLPLLKASYGVVTLDVLPAGPKKGDVSKLELRGTFRYGSKKEAEAAAVAVGDLRGIVCKGIEELKGERPGGGAFPEQLNGGIQDALKALGRADLGRADTPPANDRELLLTATVRGPKDVGTLAFVLGMDTVTRHISSDGGAPKPDANLKTLAEALLAYEKEHGRLPPHTIYAKDGKTPLLSWRVLLLPYLGDDAKKLHARFKLDEPWDSEHNIRLVSKMPKLFAPTGEIGSSSATTHFQLFTGPDTLFPGPKGARLKDATDGAANTILLAQATRAVPWSKPQDLEYAAKKPVPLIGVSGHSLAGPCAQVAFADGTVRVFRAPLRTESKSRVHPIEDPFGKIEGWSESFDESALRGLITPAGGEKVKPEGGFSKPAKAVPADPVPGLPAPIPLPPAKHRG